MNPVSIVGIGSWVPDRVVTNDAWPPEFSRRASSPNADRTLNDIESSADSISAAILERDLAAEANDPFLGTKYRRYAPDGFSAGEGEGIAAQQALKSAVWIDPSEIDLVLTYGVVPDRISMQTGAQVAQALGIKHNVMYSIVDNTCASVSSQLMYAKAMIETGQAKNVLCTQSSIWTRTFPMGHPASPGVGDACTALLVSAKICPHMLEIRSNYGAGHPEHLKSVAWVRAASDFDGADVPWWKAGTEDFRMGSKNPPGVKELMKETVRFAYLTIEEACRRAGITTSDLKAIASVQPRGFIPPAIAERCGLPRSAGISTYEDYAHCGASGVVLNLERLLEEGLSSKDYVALYGQGFGFTRTASVLQYRR